MKFVEDNHWPILEYFDPYVSESRDEVMMYVVFLSMSETDE